MLNSLYYSLSTDSIDFSLSTNASPNGWWFPFAILLLHARTVFFLRTIRFFERYFAIIIFVAGHIFSFFVIFIILAYADTFWIFLRTVPPVHDSDMNLYVHYYASIVGLFQIMSGRFVLFKVT